MNALKGSITCAAKLLSPKFYAEKYGVILSNTRKSLHAGSPAPLFKAMLLVGVVGYTMEYSMVGSKFFFIASCNSLDGNIFVQTIFINVDIFTFA